MQGEKVKEYIEILDKDKYAIEHMSDKEWHEFLAYFRGALGAEMVIRVIEDFRKYQEHFDKAVEEVTAWRREK